jgi:TM2 domain-containing membrane protein YozV
LNRRSYLVAYVLWFFLGLLGIHRFYLGRPVSGVIWLLTGGLFGIGWLVDVVLTAMMVEEENRTALG